MKQTMKLTIKLFLIVSLFCSVALAEGDMDGGGLVGDMDGGGLKCAKCVTDDDKPVSLLTVVQDYLSDLFG